MMKSKRSASESVLQRVYDEAYRSFVDAMFEDAQGHGEAALEGWLNTLARIEDDHAKIIASPQVSSQEITLYARIVDIERQSKDRVYTYAQSFSGNSLSPDELKIVYEQLRAEKRRQIQEQRALEEAAKQLPQRSGNRKASRPDAMRSVSGGSTTSTLTSQPPPAPARAPSPIKKTMLMTLRGPRHFKKDSSSTTAKASKSKTTQVPAATAATVAWSASSSNNSPPHYAPPRQSSETSRQVSSSAPADEEGLMKAMFKNFSSTSLTSIPPANEAPNSAATSNSARRNPSSSSTNAEADFPQHSYPPPPPKAPTPDYILHPEPRRPANGSLPAQKVRDSRSPSPLSVQHESLDSNRNEGLLKLKPSESFIGSVMTSFPVSAPPVPPRSDKKSDKKSSQPQQSQSPSADAIYASSESSAWSPVVAGNNNSLSSRSHPFGPRTPALPLQPVRASSVIRKPVPGFPAQPIKSDSTASNGLPFQFGTEPPPSMSPPPPPAPPPRPPQYTVQSSSSTNIQSPLASPKYPVPPPFNYADSKPSTPSAAPASAPPVPPVPPAPPAEPAAPVASTSESKPEETTEERGVPPVVVSADEKKEEEQPPVAPEAKAATSSTANSTSAPTTAQAAPAESLSLPPSTFPFHPHSSKPNGVTAKASAGRASPMTAGQRKTQAATRTRANGGANSMTSQFGGQKDGSKEKRSHQPYGLTPPSSTRRLMSPTRASAAKAKPPIHAPTPQKATEQPTLVPATSTTTTTNPDGHLPPLLPDSPDPEHQEWNNRVNEALKNIVGVEENAARQILNEIVVKGDEVHWDDIAGLEQAKTSLKETVVYPFLRPDLFKGLREPARGMLLFGPPGTGKTMLARAVATESQSTFFSISASSLTSKYLGESEKLVKALFALARALAPSIIFVDEIDSLLSSRSDTGEHEASRRIKTEFLVKWSDLAHAAAGRDHQDDNAQRVLVLAATNLPWAIDEAARRRFVRRQYIPLPERETRKKHLQTLLEYQVHGLSEEDVDRLVDMTDGFSGSDITALAKDAAMGPLRALGEALLSTPRDQIRPVTVADFEASLKTIRPSVSKEGLQAFEEWALKYGSSGA